MKTYSYSEEGTGLVLRFYVDNVYVSINSMVGVLSGVDGVTDICRRRLFFPILSNHLERDERKLFLVEEDVSQSLTILFLKGGKEEEESQSK